MKRWLCGTAGHDQFSRPDKIAHVTLDFLRIFNAEIAEGQYVLIRQP